ncbi:hypothetical protein Gogos_013983 [Gossypium gossypioides]|uniref:JAB1/MPN/MOV34 metalloenzyme domain-containing protein n=1 Tax=Gossypium gossypioides TaxID=34282 RepID=A0A7J9BXC0_GOSGO|nr:hypothetical protein [Gossypium gossypioides]
MMSSTERINIAASAQRLDVDNRIPLRYYYRIADNILKQADIFRAEKNIIDLYIMLLRFSGLLNALNELEELKPAVQQKINELNRRYTNQSNSLQQSAVKNQSLTYYGMTKAVKPAAREFNSYGPIAQQLSYSKPMEEQFRRMSLNLMRPKDETLSKHSILGPNGLYGQWQPPKTNIRQAIENKLPDKSDHSNSEPEASSIESTVTVGNCENSQKSHVDEPCPMISFEESETAPVHINVTRQPSPPPVLAEVQDLVHAISPQVKETDCRIDNPSTEALVPSESPLQLHISTTMMESFMKLAKSNTNRNLETCGVLAGSLKNRKFYVTALIIPKQESTSDSTHPTQSCFMSSIDLHTHYSYQIMLPESVAIVMAPRDASRKHGIFRLTTPGGMSVIRQCQKRGFHPHIQPPDGGPLYSTCSDVYMNPNLNFDVIDLR